MNYKKFTKTLMLSTAMLGMLIACDSAEVPSDLVPGNSEAASSEVVSSEQGEQSSQNYGDSSQNQNSSENQSSSTPNESSAPSENNNPAVIKKSELKAVTVNILTAALGEEPIEGVDYEWDSSYEEYYGYALLEAEATETLETFLERIISTCIPASFELTEEGIYVEQWLDGSDGYFADLSANGIWVLTGDWDNTNDTYGFQIEVFADPAIEFEDDIPEENQGGEQGGEEGGNEGGQEGGNEGDDTPVTKADLKAVIEDIFTAAYGEAPVEDTDYAWDDEYEEYYGYIYFEVEDTDTLESMMELFIDYYVPLEFDFIENDDIYQDKWEDDSDGYFADLYGNGIWVMIGNWDDGDGYFGFLVEVFSNSELADDGDSGSTVIDIPEGGSKVSFMNPWGTNSGADVNSLPEKLKSFINEKVGSNVVKNITATACQVMKVDDVVKGDFCCLVIGSSKAGGELVISFNSTIKSVTIEFETYGKTYTNGGQQAVSIDSNACVYVNGTQVDMSVTGDATKTETKAFEINSNTLTLSNKAEKQRVFIKSITFNF